MVAVAIHQLLGTETVTRAISRIKTPQDRFQQFLGMGPGGANTSDQGGRLFGWDIQDKTRKLATGRPSGVGPATRTLNPIGHISMAAYRSHEKALLLWDRLHRTRPLGGQWGSIDDRGQRYVTSQEEYMAQLFKNTREFICSRVLRGGSFQVKINGDDWIPVDSGGHFTVDFKIPAGNKSQLNMTGGGDIIGTSWATTSTNIPLHLLKINAAFEQNHGYPLRHVWMNSNGIINVMANTEMQGYAGTANRVFESFNPTGLTGPDGVADTGFTVRFNAVPWVTFHVYDGGLEVDGTYTKFLTDTTAMFTPDISGTLAEWYNGSELVQENLMSEPVERFGLAAWTTKTIDPPGFEMKTVDIGMPAVYIPKAFAYGTVVF